MNPDKEYTLTVWNRLVAEHGADPVQLADSRAQFATEYQRDVMAGRVTRLERSLIAEGEALFDKHVRPERDRRAKGKHGFAENIANSLLGNEDPHLDLAVPLGNGSDKTLRYWTREDWYDSIKVREKSAQDTVDAAAEHKMYAMRVIESLAHSNAAYTGQLFERKAA